MNKSRVALCLLVALGLSACGGSDDSSSPEEVSAILTANNDSGETSNGNSLTVDVLANDEYTGNADLSVSIVSNEEAAGTAEVDGTNIVFTPAEGFIGSTDITYSVTDGELSSEATVSVVSGETLSIKGTVTDSPISNANVSVTFNGETYRATADAEGNYTIELSVTSDPSDEAIRIEATGAEENDQAYVALSSLLAGYDELSEASGDDRVLERSESNSVQVTQVSTAEDVLVKQLAEEAEISAEEVALLKASIDADKLLEVAGVIKLLVDSSDKYTLPEGKNTISDLLSDEAAYEAIVEKASQGENSDLDQAINETLADESVAEKITLEDIKGTYFYNIRGNKTIGKVAGRTWHIGDNGEFVDYWDSLGQLPVVTTGSYTVEDGILSLVTEASSFRFDVPQEYSDGRYDDLDTELLDALNAWVEENHSNTTFQINYKSKYLDFKALSSSNDNLTVSYTEESALSAWEFEWNGQTYQVPEVVTDRENNVTRTLLDKASTKAQTDGAFDLAANSTWVLPIFGMSANATEGAFGLGDIVTFSGTSGSEGAFEGKYTASSGDWSLSEDGSTLTLSYVVNNHAITTTLIMRTTNSLLSTAFAEHVVESNGNEESPLAYLNGTISSIRAIAPYTSVSSEGLAPNKAVGRFLNAPTAPWVNGVPPVEALTSFWYFAEDGLIDTVRRQCNGEDMQYGDTCSAENFSLTVADGESQSNLAWRTTDDDHIVVQLRSLQADYVFYEPLSVDEEPKAVAVLEYWNNAFTDADCTPSTCSLELYPRITVWRAMDDVYDVERVDASASSMEASTVEKVSKSSGEKILNVH